MKKANTVIVLEQALVKSPAWLSVSGVAPHVYLLFRCRCQISCPRSKSGKGRPIITKNGLLEFTYAEARERYGMTAPQFRRAIDQLIDRGFLDVTGTGMGVYRVKNTYGISDRWRDYGTPAFVEAKRPSASIRNCGFQPGNKLTPKKKSSDVFVHGAVNENVHSGIRAMYTNVHGEKVHVFPKSLWVETLCSEIA